MTPVSGLRSPYDKVGRLGYFGRMLDKIRLHAAGRLPPDYVANLGEDSPRGFAYALSAYFLWGFLPVYLKTLSHVGTVEVLAHRVIWSVPSPMKPGYRRA